jgi:hypothetical protein
MKKIADKGSSEAFLRANLAYDGDECLPWPFRLTRTGYGYAVVGGVQKRASRWMCALAHGEPPTSRHEAAHSCGNPHCVNPKHLRWATPKQNSDDKRTHGTTIHGERNGKTKLTADDVRAIRAAPPDLNALMARYGVSKGCISKIRSGRRWEHVA